MKAPEIPDKSIIFKALYKFRHNMLSACSIRSICQQFSEFVFKFSKETALIMLIFNAISIMSSHLAQINGLRKSERENKNYLITQEFSECLLDFIFTIVPPFAIENFLKKQIDGGKITTKSMQKKMVDYVAPGVGASFEDLYHTDHIKPVSVQINTLLNRAFTTLIENKKTPTSLKDKLKAAKIVVEKKLPDVNKKVPVPSLEDIVIDFEENAKTQESFIPDDVLKNFYHGSVYDDIWGTRTGILVLATLGYTVLASCVITPILKNKLSNRAYTKQLKKMGETRESIKRKERYDFSGNSVLTSSDTDIFSSFNFLNEKNNSAARSYDMPENLSKQSVFNTFKPILSQSKRLRI